MSALLKLRILPCAVDAARLDQHVLGLAAIGAAVHAQRAADRAGNAAEERQARDAGLLRRARHHHVEHRGAGGDAMAVFDLDLVEAAAEPDHHARHAAVAHDQVGAGADHRDRNVGRQIAQEISQIVFVLRHEERLRRTADAEPGELAERLVGQQPPAQFRQARLSARRTMSGKLIMRQRLQFRPAAHRPIA